MLDRGKRLNLGKFGDIYWSRWRIASHIYLYGWHDNNSRIEKFMEPARNSTARVRYRPDEDRLRIYR